MSEKWTFNYQMSMPTHDPYLLINFINDNTVLLFDCGVRVWGNVKTILKIKHLFITHAHIDHIIGFDHILRALLGENTRLVVYGPQGIRQRISSKLNGYDWDRAADQELVVEIHELYDGQRIVQVHECRKRFQLSSHPEVSDWDGLVVKDSNYSVHAVEVDHGNSPCLAYVMSEVDHLRIDKDRMVLLGLRPGPWVGRLLNLAQEKAFSEEIPIGDDTYTVKWLFDNIVTIQKGKRVSYVTDTVFSDGLMEKLKRFAFKSDILICESTFLNDDFDLAKKYHHLTSRQAGIIAKTIQAEKLILFHISNRYFPKIYRIVNDARKEFKAASLPSPPDRHRRTNSKKHHDM